MHKTDSSRNFYWNHFKVNCTFWN
uniref:Uncharacterized protein n=1 Tax=Rhizophora mucronata TaxID=61149 RepID=A0A2P2N4K6_RHIMU